MALIGKGGVDKRQYLEILTSTLFGAPVYKAYGALIADGTFEPAGFAAPIGFKDIRLALAAAEELRAPLPIASLLRDRFLTLLANGGEELDWSVIGALAAWEPGVGKVVGGWRAEAWRSMTRARRRGPRLLLMALCVIGGGPPNFRSRRTSCPAEATAGTGEDAPPR